MKNFQKDAKIKRILSFLVFVFFYRFYQRCKIVSLKNQRSTLIEGE